MLVTHAQNDLDRSCLARDCPSAPSRAGHRSFPEFANIQSIAQDSYFAGLFDGEGCVSSQIPKRTNRTGSRTVVCQIVMTERAAIAKLAEVYGGTVVERNMARWNPNAKPAFQWSVCGQIALRFMKAIHPYTIVKREQIELAIRIQECMSTNKSIMNRHSKSHSEKATIFGSPGRMGSATGRTETHENSQSIAALVGQ